MFNKYGFNPAARFRSLMKNDTKSILWIIDGSLKNQLHKNARISPAIELTKYGWQVTMVTSEAPDDLINTPVQFVEVRYPKIYFIGVFLYYIKILMLLFLNKLPAGILFFQLDSMGLMLLMVPLWQDLMKKKCYHVVLDYRSMPMDTLSLRGKLRSFVFYVGHRVASKLDLKITAITDRIAKELNLRRDQLIGIWPSGANIDDFKIAVETRVWPAMNDPIRLVYIGAMQYERNLIAVIDAARIAKNRGVDLRLDIIGSGEQKESLQKIAEKRGKTFIKVWGPIPQSHIPGLLAKYDIGILPFPDIPKMNVSSAIKMFEYMAAGMPILATYIEAHVSVFKDSDFVFWASENAKSMADAIVSMNALKAQLPALGRNSRNYSKSWSWSESARKLSDAIESITVNDVDALSCFKI